MESGARSQRPARAAPQRRVRMRRQLARPSSSSTSTSPSSTAVVSASPSTPSPSSSTISGSAVASTASASAPIIASTTAVAASAASPATSAAVPSSSTTRRTSSALPTSTGPRLQHVAQPSSRKPDRFTATSALSSSSFAYGPIYTPLILAPDSSVSSSPMPPVSSDVSAAPPAAVEKRKVGGLSMGLGVLIGALALAALLVPTFFLYRYMHRRRRAQVWSRRRRLTHIDPGAHVGEHVEKFPVSPFITGAPRPASVMHISGGDEEGQYIQFAERTTPTSADLLVPAQSPSSAQSPGSAPSPGSQRSRPAALALARSGTATTRQSTPDGAVEFTLGVQPPSEPSASTLPTATTEGPPPRRSSIEKRPVRALVAHNALTPPATPGQTPLQTPAPRYSQAHITSIWARLSGRNSVVPPAYESPRPHQTAHLQVPVRSPLRTETVEEEEADSAQAWAPLRIARRQDDLPQLPKPSFDGGGRI